MRQSDSKRGGSTGATLLMHESSGPGSSKADFAVWSEMAQNREVWQHLEGDYLIFCEHRLNEA